MTIRFTRMTPFIFLLGIDSALGRFDSASLPQQALMELLINGITNREIICGSQEEPSDITEWKGVTVDDKEEVIEVDYSNLHLEGSVNIEWLPSTVEKLSMAYNRLSGTIELLHLPQNLKRLHLGGNTFSGTVNLTKLPGGMSQLYLQDNNFTGETDFGFLPKSLRALDISNTRLSGEIYLKEKKYGFDVFNSKVKIVMSESQEQFSSA